VTGTVVEAGGTVVVEMSVAINEDAVGAAVVSAIRLARTMSLILEWCGLGDEVSSCVWMLLLEEVDGDARESAKDKRASTRSYLSGRSTLTEFETCRSEQIGGMMFSHHTSIVEGWSDKVWSNGPSHYLSSGHHHTLNTQPIQIHTMLSREVFCISPLTVLSFLIYERHLLPERHSPCLAQITDVVANHNVTTRSMSTSRGSSRDSSGSTLSLASVAASVTQWLSPNITPDLPSESIKGAWFLPPSSSRGSDNFVDDLGDKVSCVDGRGTNCGPGAVAEVDASFSVPVYGSGADQGTKGHRKTYKRGREFHRVRGIENWLMFEQTG
jgi:hypothetical protein